MISVRLESDGNIFCRMCKCVALLVLLGLNTVSQNSNLKLNESVISISRVEDLVQGKDAQYITYLINAPVLNYIIDPTGNLEFPDTEVCWKMPT